MRQGDYNKLVYDIKDKYPEQTRIVLKNLETLTGLKFNDNAIENYNNFYNWVKNVYIPENDKAVHFQIKNKSIGIDIAGSTWIDIQPIVNNFIIKHFYDEYQTLQERFSFYAVNMVIHLANQNFDLNLKIDEIRHILDSELDDYLLNKIYERDERLKYENQIIIGKPYQNQITETDNTVNE
jgi:hypothetical protein